MAVEAPPAPDLRETLTPYVQKLTLVPAAEDSGPACAIVVGTQKLEINSWERETLAQALGGSTDGGWRRLLVEGYALQAKYLTEFAGRDAAGESIPESSKRLLADDATLGLVLMEQIQRAINSMVLSGQIEQAKHLSTFRNKVGNTVTAMKDQLGDLASRAAEARALKIVPPVEPGPVRAHVPEPRPIQKKRRPATVVVPEADEPADRTRPLLLILAASIVAWVVVVLPRMTDTPMPVLTLQELPHTEVIQQLSARPPSLFVEVRNDVWDDLGRDERLRIVEGIGQAAGARGYTGAQFTVSEGGTVGSWLREAGPALVKRSDSPS